MTQLCTSHVRRKAVWGPRRIVWPLLILLLGIAPQIASADGRHIPHRPIKKPGHLGKFVRNYHLDDALEELSRDRNGSVNTSRVIVELKPGHELPREFKYYVRRFAVGDSSDGTDHNLDLINGVLLELPNNLLKKLASKGEVFRVHLDRPIMGHVYRTSITVGARTVQESLGYTGKGIGVAVIDSGITTWHDDLTNKTSTVFPYGNQRVRKFVDFVNGQPLPYDDNGHGTHVTGTIAGNGTDSNGDKAGIAPKASIISLKVLDAEGRGTISNIIAALNWVAANAAAYNIKVVNMSVGAGIYESYWTDPLTLAAKAVTDKGITIVCAAGNLGKNLDGKLQYGGITAPANAPWVLTVGASSTMGTLTRSDDEMADFSSAGPTAIDFEAKPDLVAPGTGTVSLAAPGSTFYVTKAAYLLAGKLGLGSRPYLALSGTSMAAPVVSGTVALMLQANPNLTPNLVKAILQYTAQEYPDYKALRQGAGFLNTLGAVELARFYATAAPGARMPVQRIWSQKIIWGSHELRHGVIKPSANAWGKTVVWGSAKTGGVTGQNIVWGVNCGSDCMNIVWGVNDSLNIVWGTAADDLNIVWGTSGDDMNIVWGTAGDDLNIVWGTDCGGDDCANIMWGTADDQNIVWGVADPDSNIMWGTSADDMNIVWGTSNDGDTGNAIVYPDDASEPLPSLLLEFGDVLLAPVEGNHPTTGGF